LDQGLWLAAVLGFGASALAAFLPQWSVTNCFFSCADPEAFRFWFQPDQPAVSVPLYIVFCIVPLVLALATRRNQAPGLVAAAIGGLCILFLALPTILLKRGIIRIDGLEIGGWLQIGFSLAAVVLLLSRRIADPQPEERVERPVG